jgi:histidinol-phosphate aminotransferase
VFTIDVDALLARIGPRTKLVFIANPNNPTSTCIDRDSLRRLVEGVPSEVVLVIDAAYAEYATAADYAIGHEYVAARENVLVLRTLSKAFGLAALRVGWAHCPVAMARLMNQVRGVGNVNAVAQAAACAALEDMAFVADVVARNAATRERLAARYRALGLQPLPSQANFFAVGFPSGVGCSAKQAFEHLTRRGIWIRALADCGMPEHLRITIGTDADNERLFAALSEVLGR